MLEHLVRNSCFFSISPRLKTCLNYTVTWINGLLKQSFYCFLFTKLTASPVQLKHVESTEHAARFARVRQVQFHVLALDLAYKCCRVPATHLWQSFIQGFWMSKGPGKVSQSSKKTVDDVKVIEGFMFQHMIWQTKTLINSA